MLARHWERGGLQPLILFTFHELSLCMKSTHMMTTRRITLVAATYRIALGAREDLHPYFLPHINVQSTNFEMSWMVDLDKDSLLIIYREDDISPDRREQLARFLQNNPNQRVMRLNS